MAALVLTCATKQAGARTLIALVVIGSLVLPVGSARAGSPSGDSGGVDYSDATVAADGRAASIRSNRNSIRSRLAELESQRKNQWDRWALSALALDSARKKAATATEQLAGATKDVEVGEAKVRAYAQNAFMNPPAENNIALLNIKGAQKVSRAHDLLTVVADEQEKVVQELERLRRIAKKRSEDADRLLKSSETLAKEVEEELNALDAIVAEQKSILSDVDTQLASALAEADALRAIDVKAAEKLEAETLAAAKSIKSATASSSGSSGTASSSGAKATANTPKATPAKSGSGSSGGSSSGGSGSGGSSSGGSSSGGSSSGGSSSGGSGGGAPSGQVTWYDVVSVNGIWVHKSIAGQLRRMLAAAANSGIYLTGGGYRDPEFQKVLRAAHCGPTYYDIYQKPASQCTPPTAPPGLSLHEKGLAIDFNYGGSIIKSRSSPGFQWLASNAASYGFYNLPSEPWHWSTTGS
jgi:LAS superfamily LD-carboxypeptidase LdcB